MQNPSQYRSQAGKSDNYSSKAQITIALLNLILQDSGLSVIGWQLTREEEGRDESNDIVMV